MILVAASVNRFVISIKTKHLPHFYVHELLFEQVEGCGWLRVFLTRTLEKANEKYDGISFTHRSSWHSNSVAYHDTIPCHDDTTRRAQNPKINSVIFVKCIHLGKHVYLNILYWTKLQKKHSENWEQKPEHLKGKRRKCREWENKLRKPKKEEL